MGPLLLSTPTTHSVSTVHTAGTKHENIYEGSIGMAVLKTYVGVGMVV